MCICWWMNCVNIRMHVATIKKVQKIIILLGAFVLKTPSSSSPKHFFFSCISLSCFPSLVSLLSMSPHEIISKWSYIYIALVSVTNEWICMCLCTSERVWSIGEYWQVKSDSVENLFLCHCFHHISNRNWSGIKPYSSRGRILLYHITAYHNVKIYFVHTFVHPRQCFTNGLPPLHEQITFVSIYT